MVNIPAVVRALNDHRYDGWLVVEQDTTPLNPTNIARENRVYLETLLQSGKAIIGCRGVCKAQMGADAFAA